MSLLAKEMLNKSVLDMFTDKVRNEKTSKTKQEIIADLDIFKSLGSDSITDIEYSEILAMINIEMPD